MRPRPAVAPLWGSNRAAVCDQPWAVHRVAAVDVVEGRRVAQPVGNRHLRLRSLAAVNGVLFAPPMSAVFVTRFTGMDVDVGAPGRVGRIRAISPDAMRLWIELSDGASATVDRQDEPFELSVGTVVFLREGDNHLEVAPEEVWPGEDAGQRPGLGWVGVVKLRDDATTVVDIGGGWRLVPTNDDVEYDVGNTVQGTDATGVTRVLDRKSLRLFEAPRVGDDVIDAFLMKPSESLSFADFGGLPEVVLRARELIELPLQRRDALAKIGAEPIKGVLFTGPPGTGKTMLAGIIAASAGASFYAISGPTIFSKWYGESEEILRRIFSHAAEHAPAIIFFDEIDSVAGQRDEEAHEASKRVVAQLLTLMDGLSADENVTVIAATNRPQDIDVALRRPGRLTGRLTSRCRTQRTEKRSCA